MTQDEQADGRTPTHAEPARQGLLQRIFGGLRPATPRSGALADLRTLGRYRLLHQLGQGGMGIVFAAEDESLGRRVAVKTIAEPDESARKRFRREARAAAAVNHPNVCQVYEIGEDSGHLYIAMELLAGEPLAERLSRGAMPVDEALALGRGILAALGALHEGGIVHRDLKPSNVFLTPHGVKLLDFGLARPLPKDLTRSVAGGGGDLTRPGLIIGTPRYMAPEQVTGGDVDARADLFATAAILYEAVAGRPAFLGATVVEVLTATLHEEPPALAGDPAVVALDRVLRRALAKKRADRHASASEMLQDLEAVAGGGSHAPAAVARPLTRLVVLPFRLLRPDPEIDFLSFALADAVSTSLSGLPSVVLRSSTAAARFASEAPDFRALAAQVDVDRVLVGTLLRAGDRIRATAQLVEAPAGTIVSSQTLHAPLGDVFELQDQLAGRVVAALSPSLAGDGTKHRRGAPASARAYEFYLRANEVVRDWSQVGVARDLYRQCLDEDPAFAPAWARLGRCHRLLSKYHLERPAENLARAEEAFRRALELDPELPVAHKVYAHHEAERGRAPEAMARLLALAGRSRNDPETFAGLVHACRYCGLLDASEAAHREARRLDPHAWTSVIYTWWAGGAVERIVGEQADAMDFELRALALEMLGRTDEALAVIDALPPRGAPEIFEIVRRAIRDFLQRAPEAADRLREAVAAHTDPEALVVYGTCQARVGDAASAIETLASAIDTGYAVRESLAHPWLGPLRGPRLDALAARVEERRAAGRRVFEDNGGPALLGLARA